MLMSEICYITASTRLPIVMPVVNRALSGPINIHCDHSDTMGCRDTGWIQLFCENAQEVYDNTLQAFRVGEHKDVLLPVMACLDGFILSHTMESVEVIGPEAAQKFVGEYDPAFSLLDTEKPISIGPLHLTDYYFECKRQEVEAMENARHVILVADSTKLERTAPVRIAHLSQVDTFVTDTCPSDGVRHICDENEVRLIETSDHGHQL